MSKFKLVLAAFLIFGTFTNLQASELARLCGFSSPFLGNTPVCQEGALVFYGGQGCEDQISMSIYFANLNGYNSLPFSGIEYNLPTSMPDIYVQLDMDNDENYEVTIGPIDGFYFNGYKLAGTAQQGFHYIFEHKIDISQYFLGFNPCPQGGNKTIGSQILQMGPNDLELFEPLLYGGTMDIVSCEVFHETCSLCLDREGNPIAPNCDPSSSIPVYEADVCVDCITGCVPPSNRGTLIDNQFEVTKFAPVISPNPFLDEVVVQFETQKEHAPTEIEIYDWTGALVLKKSLVTEIGKRKTTLDMSTLPQGVYYLNLLVDESRTTSKIIKL